MCDDDDDDDDDDDETVIEFSHWTSTYRASLISCRENVP